MSEVTVQITSESALAKWDGSTPRLTRVPCLGEYLEIDDQTYPVVKVVHFTEPKRTGPWDECVARVTLKDR